MENYSYFKISHIVLRTFYNRKHISEADTSSPSSLPVPGVTSAL